MLKVVDALDGSLLEDAWNLYHAAFKDLNAYAVQRHLMYRNEFDHVMGDPQVAKYLCLDDGVLVGLSTYTNDLDAAPLISPAYFQRRWPDLFAQQKIWYCGFVGVHPAAQGSGPFVEMITAMCRLAADQGGIISLDMCSANEPRLARAVRVLLGRITGNVKAERIDAQSYWLYEFPTAARAA